MTTVVETSAKIAALKIPGVKTSKEFPPSVVSSAQLPYLYLRNMETERDNSSLSFSGGLQAVNGELVILIGVSRQSTPEELYKNTRKMMDDLQSVLEENAADLALENYTIREEFETVDTNSYFIVLCNFRCA